MKKMMMIAAMLVATLSASAQNEVGQVTLMPKVGLNLSTITGDKEDKKTKAGVVAGVEAEYALTEKFAVQGGLLYSMEGAKWSATESGVKGTYNMNVDYLQIPILAQYYLVSGLAVKAGIQPGFNVRHKQSFDLSSGSESYKDKENLEGVKSFSFSVPVGLSYEYKCFVLDARYNIGVTKVFKDADYGRNSTFAITLGYKFAL